MDFNEFKKIEEEKEYYKKLNEFVLDEYKNNICYPKYDLIFNALNKTPFDKIKVVILGQDPYHEENQAHGLAFSVLCEKLPPSLKNIYKEMESDLNIKINQDGNLTYLAENGVLLLNTILTVRAHQALSHKNKGWEIFTDNLIKEINKIDRHIVFILWGDNARRKKNLIYNEKFLIIESNHPSPLSSYRGFFGSKPFSKANDFLISNGIEPVKWYK